MSQLAGGEQGVSRERTSRKEISVAGAPRAIGPYSQAVEVGDLLCCSGQIPLDPDGGELVAGDFACQVRRVMDNLAALLAGAGMDFSNLVKVNVSLVDLSRFEEFNAVYESCLDGARPARAVVGVSSLPRGALVELEAVASR